MQISEHTYLDLHPFGKSRRRPELGAIENCRERGKEWKRDRAGGEDRDRKLGGENADRSQEGGGEKRLVKGSGVGGNVRTTILILHLVFLPRNQFRVPYVSARLPQLQPQHLNLKVALTADGSHSRAALLFFMLRALQNSGELPTAAKSGSCAGVCHVWTSNAYDSFFLMGKNRFFCSVPTLDFRTIPILPFTPYRTCDPPNVAVVSLPDYHHFVIQLVQEPTLSFEEKQRESVVRSALDTERKTSLSTGWPFRAKIKSLRISAFLTGCRLKRNSTAVFGSRFRRKGTPTRNVNPIITCVIREFSLKSTSPYTTH
ncbi:unnamed protein product, partial [Nesidiocoris tenuis]